MKVTRIKAGEYRVEVNGRAWFVKRWVGGYRKTVGWFLAPEGLLNPSDAEVYATKGDAVRAAHDYSVPSEAL